LASSSPQLIPWWLGHDTLSNTTPSTLPHFEHTLCLCFSDATAGSLMGMSLVLWTVNCLWVAS
jgi:hypothetical protein